VLGLGLGLQFGGSDWLGAWKRLISPFSSHPVWHARSPNLFPSWLLRNHVRNLAACEKRAFTYVKTGDRDQSPKTQNLRLKTVHYDPQRFLLDFRIVAETFEPVHLRLAAKPGHLSLGVVAMRLLGGLHGLILIQFSTQ
jgi:hypothetical protein